MPRYNAMLAVLPDKWETLCVYTVACKKDEIQYMVI